MSVVPASVGVYPAKGERPPLWSVFFGDLRGENLHCAVHADLVGLPEDLLIAAQAALYCLDGIDVLRRIVEGVVARTIRRKVEAAQQAGPFATGDVVVNAVLSLRWMLERLKERAAGLQPRWRGSRSTRFCLPAELNAYMAAGVTTAHAAVIELTGYACAQVLQERETASLVPLKREEDRWQGHLDLTDVRIPGVEVKSLGGEIISEAWDVAKQEPRPSPERPKWEADNKTLYWRGVAIKTYKKTKGQNQTELLAAFEREGWAPVIPDPFNDSEKLNQTLKDLRTTVPIKTIMFWADGDGNARWERMATS